MSETPLRLIVVSRDEHSGRSVWEQANAAFSAEPAIDAIAVVGCASQLPESPFERALEFLASDARIACVSLLSNVLTGFDALDPTSATQQLGRFVPDLGAIPIAFAHGPVNVFRASALRAAGAFDVRFDGAVDGPAIEFSLRASHRGFTTVLDAGTYVTTTEAMGEVQLADEQPSYPALLQDELSDGSSRSIAVNLAKAKLAGLSVLIDGSCLGPDETGVQVATVATVEALTSHSAIARLMLAIPGEKLPPYARRLESLDSLEVRTCADGDFSAFGPVDIIHRPNQPIDRIVPLDAWRDQAHRTVLTIHDLIKFGISSYEKPRKLVDYRNVMRGSIGSADAIVCISADVAKSIRSQQIDAPDSRVFVVPNGTDHNVTATPVTSAGSVDPGFLLVLGTSYSHKNRDLAVAALSELRTRGIDKQLLLVGGDVPRSRSSLDLEDIAIEKHPDLRIVRIPAVTGEERDWLLANASAVLYPTAAEGFGLIPFEAAKFGTPTVSVAFGPLAEFLPPTSATAPSWDPADIADAVERVLDPAVAAESVSQVLKAAADLTWQRTADQLVSAYFAVLAQPRRFAPAPPATSHRQRGLKLRKRRR